MSDRRFQLGDRIELAPMEYRLVRGRKGPDDLRLDWRPTELDWRPVELDHAFLIVDAIADNENVLYPYPAAGGGKVNAAIRVALRDGWQRARLDLHAERARRAERDGR